nr:hypothetical protein [Tanacetum cinerariifolium]
MATKDYTVDKTVAAKDYTFVKAKQANDAAADTAALHPCAVFKILFLLEPQGPLLLSVRVIMAATVEVEEDEEEEKEGELLKWEDLMFFD